MKIAFVGKGGAGKSTLAALFIRYLHARSGANVLALDADLNMNLAGLLGVSVEPENVLANPDVQMILRTYLKGSNPRIDDATKFVPTTPPGFGSNLINMVDDPILSPFAVRVDNNPVVNLLTVGTYGKDEIGQGSFHTHLFMAENILSHTALAADSWVVADMVAGTDTFAFSMNLEFDSIILILEPTPESIEVYNLYMDLAREAGVDRLVYPVANKIADDEDLDFICGKTGITPLAVVPALPFLKKARQRGEPVLADKMDESLFETMKTIEETARIPAIPAHERLAMLYRLHGKLMQQDWIRSGYGDVSGQVDEEYLRAMAKAS